MLKRRLFPQKRGKNFNGVGFPDQVTPDNASKCVILVPPPYFSVYSENRKSSTLNFALSNVRFLLSEQLQTWPRRSKICLNQLETLVQRWAQHLDRGA